MDERVEQGGKSADRLYSVSELARMWGVPRYQLQEWTRLGLLGRPQIALRKNGRVTVYGFRESDLPDLRKTAEELRQRKVGF